jgi:Peptidase family U32
MSVAWDAAVPAERLREQLSSMGLEAVPSPPASDRRFADGTRYRIEIPSTEGPGVLAAVLEEADRLGVAVRRVSQGSGVMMLTDAEIREMARLGADAGIEISLFIGPRSAWDIGGQSQVSSGAHGAIRGTAGLAACVAEALRAARLGIRGLLVADIGLLALLHELRSVGDLPSEMIFKTSVMTPISNPATARTMASLGAGTLNLSTDLTVEQIAEIRMAVDLPLDVYVEVPDDQGGFVRFYDVPCLVGVASPVYIKFGLRNAPSIYPSGRHIEDVAIRMGQERVRRAHLCLRLLQELAPELVDSPAAVRPSDLATPEL